MWVKCVGSARARTTRYVSVKSREESEIARAFVLRPLLRFDIQVYCIQTLRVAAIEPHNLPHAIEEFLTMRSRLVGVRAGKQTGHSDRGAV